MKITQHNPGTSATFIVKEVNETESTELIGFDTVEAAFIRWMELCNPDEDIEVIHRRKDYPGASHWRP